MLELLKDEAITEDVDVPKANHGRVIGKGGQKMTEIRDETHCIISVPGQSDKSSLISITGRKEGVARAKVLIQEAVAGPKKDEEGGDTHHAVSVKYPLAKDLHKFVIGTFTACCGLQFSYFKNVGKNGRTINEIRDETGVQIIVPKGDDADAAIVLKGDQEGIDQAIKRIREVTIASKPNNGSPRVGGGRGMCSCNNMRTYILKKVGLMEKDVAAGITITTMVPEEAVGKVVKGEMADVAVVKAEESQVKRKPTQMKTEPHGYNSCNPVL